MVELTCLSRGWRERHCGAGRGDTAREGEKSLGTAAGLGQMNRRGSRRAERVPSEGALEILEVKAERVKAAAGAAQAEGLNRPRRAGSP